MAIKLKIEIFLESVKIALMGIYHKFDHFISTPPPIAKICRLIFFIFIYFFFYFLFFFFSWCTLNMAP